jgi:hypothetical protein
MIRAALLMVAMLVLITASAAAQLKTLSTGSGA